MVVGVKAYYAVLLALVLGCGCGKKDTPPENETKPKVAAKQPKPSKTNTEPTEPKAGDPEKGGEKPQPQKAFTNTLGMKFEPVPGTGVAFCIWETRVKDYTAYAAANAEIDEGWKNFGPGFLGFKQEDTHPVVNVSWEDAQAFCEWLTKKDMAAGKIKAGQKYRLPTDAEWSMAVGLGQEKGNTPGEKNGGFDGVYPWGNEWPPPKGAGNYDPPFGGHEDGFKFTAPVGSFTANKIGLHDLGGNVWEWCEDKYIPITPKRVLRGASWADIALMLSSERSNSHPNSREIYIGFRCVLVGGSGG